MLGPVASTYIRVPLINVQIELSAKDKKVLAVAIATLALLGLQLGVSLPVTLLAVYFVTTLTWFAETQIRTSPDQQNDWFNPNFDKTTMTFWSVMLILRPFVIYAVCSVLGVPFPRLAQEGVVKLIFESPWTMIPIATIVAPIAEEILFRGFLLERFEDAAYLINRHKICPLSEVVQQEISNIAQAIIFGAMHLRSKIEEGMMLPVMFVLSVYGYINANLKKTDQSLLSPIAVHSANNIGAVIHIFASSTA